GGGRHSGGAPRERVEPRRPRDDGRARTRRDAHRGGSARAGHVPAHVRHGPLPSRPWRRRPLLPRSADHVQRPRRRRALPRAARAEPVRVLDLSRDMSATLSWNRYGKARIRLVKVRRSRDPHEIVDLTIDIQLEGAFERVYVDGDNRPCLPTDTMKNTVYAFARRDDIRHVESFAIGLADHFAAKPGVLRARVSAAEARWDRLAAGGRPHPHAFVQAGAEQWTTVVTKDG